VAFAPVFIAVQRKWRKIIVVRVVDRASTIAASTVKRRLSALLVRDPGVAEPVCSAAH
jgi:hypothetical protein